MYANHLREMRRSRGVAPTELAFRSGCSVNSLYRYERGEAEPPLALARGLARELHTTVDALFPDHEAMSAR